MIRVCYSKFHKGDHVFGEKPPLEDKSLTHGLCEECFEKEMEELERQGHIKPSWRQRLVEFEKNPRKRRKNMPRERQPRKGDFVLFDDEVWIVKESFKSYKRATRIDPPEVVIESITTGEKEVLLVSNLAPTDIQTWEAE